MAGPSKYVVAVDGDEVSAYAFTWAITNLFREGDAVLVLTAKLTEDAMPTADLTAGEYAMPVPVALSAEEDQEACARAQALVDKYMKQCEQAKLKCEGRVVDGSPGLHIVAEAEKMGADGIVVGSHGRGIIGRTFLGSISDYVRHNTQVPVVVVRAPKEGERDALASTGLPRKIAVAVDETAEATHAFTWALQQFVKDDDSVVILHVQNAVAAPTSTGTDQFGMEDVYVPPDTTNKANVEALSQSERLVEVFMKQAAEATKAKSEGRVVQGTTQERMVQELVNINADAVVVGSRSHDMLQRTFLGSVSDFLAHHSPCPIIFVKLSKPGDQTSQSGDHAHAV